MVVTSAYAHELPRYGIKVIRISLSAYKLPCSGWSDQLRCRVRHWTAAGPSPSQEAQPRLHVQGTGGGLLLFTRPSNTLDSR